MYTDEGDSGSWVTNTVTGDLYRNVVTGVPETKLAYIVPTYKTFGDGEKSVGSVELVSCNPLVKCSRW